MPQMYCSLEDLLYSPYPPPCLDVPTFTARCLHICNDTRDPSSKRWNCVGESWPVILPESATSTSFQGSFKMLQIYDMGPMALLPLWRKVCWGIFCPEKSWRLRPGLNLQTWVLKGSMLPLDHQITCTYFNIFNKCSLHTTQFSRILPPQNWLIMKVIKNFISLEYNNTLKCCKIWQPVLSFQGMLLKVNAEQ